VPVHQVSDRAHLEEVLGQGLAVLYKHSPRCVVSARAIRHVRRFAKESPETPVYLIDVVAQEEEISSWLAERLDVDHESPQVIVVRDGKAVSYHAHFTVTAEALGEVV